MTEITPPASPIDACPPAASAASAPASAGSGFKDTLAGVVMHAAPDSPATSDSDRGSGPASNAGTATPGATKPAATAVAPPDAPPNTAPSAPSGTLPAAVLDGNVLEAPGDIASAIVKHAGSDGTKGTGHCKGKDKDHSADAGAVATDQPGRPAALQVPATGCNPIVVVLPAPPPTETKAGPPGGPDRPHLVGVKGQAGKPVLTPLDDPEPSTAGAVEAHKVSQAPVSASDGPAANAVTAFAAVMSGAAQGVALTPPAHSAPAAPVISSPASPAASPAPAHAPDRSPAGQVAPVMVSLASSGAGVHHLVVRLDPPDLGRVEVRMSRGPDTGATVEVVVERPATLTLLHQDAPALHQALSDAGVPAQGRSLTMQLGQPGGQGLTGQGGGGQGGWSPRRFGAPGAISVSASARVAGVQFLAPRALRSALDITA